MGIQSVSRVVMYNVAMDIDAKVFVEAYVFNSLFFFLNLAVELLGNMMILSLTHWRII